jgi:type II secretory pathway pseudopilin PulG
MRKRFKAFTLVEMLIVMGIIIILMAVGIASGRYALQRANRIEHENAAEQIYQALMSYYSDMRQFPDEESPSSLIGTTLAEHIDNFDGGSAATYIYDVDDTNQVFLVCVSLGGLDDAGEQGYYCTGNGIDAPSGTLSVDIPEKQVPYSTEAPYTTLVAGTDLGVADWDPESEWGAPAT